MAKPAQNQTPNQNQNPTAQSQPQQVKDAQEKTKPTSAPNPDSVDHKALGEQSAPTEATAAPAPSVELVDPNNEAAAPQGTIIDPADIPANVKDLPQDPNKKGGADEPDYTPDPDQPKQGEKRKHPNGDVEIYQNGAWVVHPAASEHVGQ